MSSRDSIAIAKFPDWRGGPVPERKVTPPPDGLEPAPRKGLPNPDNEQIGNLLRHIGRLEQQIEDLKAGRKDQSTAYRVQADPQRVDAIGVGEFLWSRDPDPEIEVPVKEPRRDWLKFFSRSARS